jgi:phospholipid/cholesterol/gamma-HCH transport system permease protein
MSEATIRLEGDTLAFTGALDKVTALDSIGAVMLLGLDKPLNGAPANIADVLERNRRALEAAPPVKPEKELPALQALGAGAIGKVRTFGSTLAYIGEVTVTMLRAPFQRGGLRPAELMRHLDEAGLRAFPLTILLGTLIGVILAFQSSIPLKRFGAEIFVPNLVGISLLRELGPLMAAIIMSGRTGSAYAAELGTMVVNEEVDALRIMGVDAIAMLVLPRIIAACLAMPVLALVMDLTGLIGMTGVMAALGFPLVAVTSQLKQWLSLKDLLGGLFKAAVFGAAIGMIGCRAGLAAARGPRAVGDAATGAVVGGIVAIIVLDGVFAILFYRLGL